MAPNLKKAPTCWGGLAFQRRAGLSFVERLRPDRSLQNLMPERNTLRVSFLEPGFPSVCGGEGNNAIDNDSTVTGGSGNTAGSLVTFFAGIGSSVLGGSGNNAGGRNTVVIGGQNVTDNNDNSIAPKPPFP